MTIVAVAGWCSNHFSASAFPGRSDMTSAIGAFVVGTLGNIYGRFSHGASFPVTVVGILYQLPSGLANGGIFKYVSAFLLLFHPLARWVPNDQDLICQLISLTYSHTCGSNGRSTLTDSSVSHPNQLPVAATPIRTVSLSLNSLFPWL